jgi:hypothetical protein
MLKQLDCRFARACLNVSPDIQSTGVTIHHPTKTGENGQILHKFGAKNFRKSAAYGLYVRF